MSFSGGIQGLHFVNSMDNRGLVAGGNKAKGIVSNLAAHVARANVFGPLAAGAIFAKLSSDAYDFSNSFSMAMREVQTISQAVQDDFEGIGDKIVNLASNGPDDAIQLAKAYYQIVSAGYDGAKGLNLLDVSSKAATAGITDTKTAADGLTTVLNAWGKDAGEAERVADIMFKTVEKGKTTFPELASSIAQVAPMASAMNVSFEEISAAIATLTKQGNSTPMAITQIRSSLIAMNDVLGDGWSKTMTYQDGLQKIRDIAGGSDTKLKELMGRVEGMNAVLALTGGKALEAAKDLDAMATSTGAMSTAYGKMMLEADNQWAMVQNKWNARLKDFGDNLKYGSSQMAIFLNALLSGTGEGAFEDYYKNGFNSFSDRMKFYRQSGVGGMESFMGAMFSSNDKMQSEFTSNFKNIFDVSQYEQNLKNITSGTGTLEEKQKKLNKEYEQFVKYLEAGGEISLVEDAILLSSKYNKLLTEENGKLDEKTTKLKTLQSVLTEIEAIDNKIGTGSIKQDAEFIGQKASLQDWVKEYFEKIRELRTTDSDKSISKSGELKLKSAKLETKEIKGQLKPMKTLTDEERKQLELQQKQTGELIKQEALIPALSEGFDDMSRILGAISYAVGEVDQDLGQSIGKMADLAYNASNLLTNLETNPTAALSSAIAVFGNIAGLLSNIDKDSGIEEFNSQLERTNELLDIQNSLLQTSKGLMAYDVYASQITLLNDSISKYIDKLNSIKIIDAANRGAKVDTSGWDVNKWANWYTEMVSGNSAYVVDPFSNEIDNVGEYIQALVDANAEVEGLKTSQTDLLGFSSDDIESVIREGALQGKDSMKILSDGFEGFMKEAVLKSLSAQYLAEPVKAWQQQLSEYMSDGSLSAEEKELARKRWNEIVNSYNTQLDIAGQTSGLDFSSVSNTSNSGLPASIRRDLTEETGTEMAGLLRKMSDDGRMNRDYNAIAVNHLQAVEQNTANTVDRLDKAVTELKAINSNTKQGQGSYDLGV